MMDYDLLSNSTLPFYANEYFMESLSVWASPKNELHLTLENFVLTAVYSAIFLAGVIGNFLTAYVVLKRPHMNTVTNRLIFNLALSDSFFMLCLPFVIVTSIERSWIFGGIMCKAYYAINCVNIFAGSFTLAILSADRYIAVCHSVYAVNHRSPAKVMIAIVISWFFSCVATLPVVCYAVVVDRDSIDVDDGDEDLSGYNGSFYHLDGLPYDDDLFSYPLSEYSLNFNDQSARNGLSFDLETVTNASPPHVYDSHSRFNSSDLGPPAVLKSLTCSVDFPTNEAYPMKFAYVVYSTIVGFIIPVIAIIVFYSLLVMRLASSTSKVDRKRDDEVITTKSDKRVSIARGGLPSNDPSCQELIAEQRKTLFSPKSISSPDIPADLPATYFLRNKPIAYMPCVFLQHSNHSAVCRVSSCFSDGNIETFKETVGIAGNSCLPMRGTGQIISIWLPQKSEKYSDNSKSQRSMKEDSKNKEGLNMSNLIETAVDMKFDSRTPTNNPTISSADKNSNATAGGHDNEGPNNSSRPSREDRHPRGSKKHIFLTANSSRRHRKVTRLVTAVIIVYVACWLPYYAFQLQLLVDPRTVAKHPWTMYLYYIVTTLTYLNSVLNPVLYALTNKNFQDAFKDTFSCCIRGNHLISQQTMKSGMKR